MYIESTLARLRERGVCAVVRGINLDHLPATLEAIVAGGIDCIEVTMSVRGALRELSALKQRWGDEVLIGAGEVLNADMVMLAAKAGADFCSGVGASPGMIEACHQRDLLAIPGGLTPTELLAAWHAGAALVNLFPADALGLTYFETVHRALPRIELMPSGGINVENAGDFVRAGAVAVGVGLSIVDPGAVAGGNLETVTQNAAALVEAVGRARASGA
jgi:2-dehydro-3-deoxyphosphogluconate aldolase / (4S)-4-hydroxy-2-oxoglutarate aldolase